jgi:hypothetical protein
MEHDHVGLPHTRRIGGDVVEAQLGVLLEPGASRSSPTASSSYADESSRFTARAAPRLSNST